MKKMNCIYASVLIAIGVFANVYARRYAINDKNIQLGPEFFPVLLSYCLIAVALALLLTAIFGKEQQEAVNLTAQNVIHVLIIIGAFIAYYLLLKPLGFILSSALLVALSMYLLGCKKPVLIIIYSILMPAAVFALFYYALEVSLPLGVLKTIIPRF